MPPPTTAVVPEPVVLSMAFTSCIGTRSSSRKGYTRPATAMPLCSTEEEVTMRLSTLAFAATAALLWGLATTATAQMEKLNSAPPAERAKAQTEMMKADLKLSAEQTKKVS